MKNKAKLIEIVKKYGIPPFDQDLIDCIEYSIRLTSTSSSKIKIGQTKFGGNPHLPNKADWPKTFDGNHYSFLLQVNLSEITNYDSSKLLPQSGMLYFFLNLESWNDGQVVYKNNFTTLKEITPPTDIFVEKKTFLQRIFNWKGRSHYLNEFGIKINKTFYVPSFDSLRVDRIAKKHNIKKRNYPIFTKEVYEEELFYEDGENEMTSNHHLLGLYNGIQNEYHEIELINSNSKNINIEDIEKALNWKLLLQLDSDKLMNWSWGDWGKIYFFIHQDDLRNGAFEKVQIIGECY